MPNSTLTIYVEGDQDKIIVQNLLVASRLSDNVELIVCGGKQQVANQISTLRDTSSHRHIALIDADLLSVADSSVGAGSPRFKLCSFIYIMPIMSRLCT